MPTCTGLPRGNNPKIGGLDHESRRDKSLKSVGILEWNDYIFLYCATEMAEPCHRLKFNSGIAIGRMKVLLINPSRTYLEGTKGVRLGLPLGVMYIAAYLEKKDVPVAIFDCLLSKDTEITVEEEITRHGVSDEDFTAKVRQEQPDIIGISCMFTAQLDNATHALRLAKQAVPDIPVVMGGPHFSADGKKYLEEHPEADFSIAGEGEHSMYQLVDALENDKPLTDIPGLIYWTNEAGGDKRVTANNIAFIPELDELPLPAYHLVDMDFYFDELERGLKTRPSIQSRSISMITSRGCPYTCNFCSIHLHMGYRWRPHSVAYTIEHIKFVADNYGVKHINFEDDNFTFKRRRSNEIALRMVEENIRVKWDTPNGIRADTLNDELLINMKKSGCTHLIVAAESGDQHIVDTIVKKKLKLEHIVRAAYLCKKHKIELGCFFIIGFPGETLQNIQNTFDFAYMLHRDYNVDPYVMVATPLPGTELYDVVLENDYNNNEITPHALAIATQTKGRGLITTPEFDPEDLMAAYSAFDARMFRFRVVQMLKNPLKYPLLIWKVLNRINRLSKYWNMLNPKHRWRRVPGHYTP